MYIEMKKTGLDVSDLITLVQRKGGGNTGFPYKRFVCRCSNCLYSTKGKCALKECGCMDARIRAYTCTFGEMMRYCFSGIGDNVFHFRLRIAIEREAELKSCFLDAGHRKRFYEGLAYTRKASNNLIAQIFFLSAYESLWLEAKKVLERGADNTFTTLDDIITTYNFDSEGRAVCVYSNDGAYRKTYGASTSGYTEADGTSRKKNRISSYAVTGYIPQNLLTDGSAETSGTWTAFGVGRPVLWQNLIPEIIRCL